MDWVIVGIAGFLGGMLNAVAGGGSFMTLAALTYVGLPPVTANATGTAALLPGYIASAWRFRKDIEYPASLNLNLIILISVVGGSLGAVLLIVLNPEIFSVLVPWLILLATSAFIIGPWLLAKRTKKKLKNDKDSSITATQLSAISAGLILLSVCIYGGYFNGGLGIILLAALGLMGQTNLHGMNGLKNIVSALLTAVAVIVYAIGGTIDWEQVLLVAVMAIIGGYVGAAVAYKIPQNIMKGFIVLVGVLMAITFFMK